MATGVISKPPETVVNGGRPKWERYPLILRSARQLGSKLVEPGTVLGYVVPAKVSVRVETDENGKTVTKFGNPTPKGGELVELSADDLAKAIQDCVLRLPDRVSAAKNKG